MKDLENIKASQKGWMSWLTGFRQKYETPETSLDEDEEEEKSHTTEEFDELIDKYTDIIEKKAHPHMFDKSIE